MSQKYTIGRTDKADFPEFGLEEIDVKIDTGAYGCSIHCDHIEEIEENGVKRIHFQLLDPKHEQYNHKPFSTEHYTVKTVKSSTGVPEERFVIESEIRLFNLVFPIRMSLTNRGEMRYPVLLGRTLLNGNFIVDTAKTNLSYKHKTKHSQ